MSLDEGQKGSTSLRVPTADQSHNFDSLSLQQNGQSNSELSSPCDQGTSARQAEQDLIPVGQQIPSSDSSSPRAGPSRGGKIKWFRNDACKSDQSVP